MCEISPEYLREIITNYITPRPIRFLNKNYLKVYDERTFAFNASFVWNLLSEEVRRV